MSIPRAIEYGFLLALLVGIGFVAWSVFAPFLGTLALSIVVAVLVYPFFTWLHAVAPWKKYNSISAFLTVFGVYTIIIGSVSLMGAALLKEARIVYQVLSTNGAVDFEKYIANTEQFFRSVAPDFNVDISGFAQEIASFIASNISTLFTGTATTIGLLFLSMLMTFYLLRDGKEAVAYVIAISPLRDIDDRRVFDRIVGAIRGVVFGVMVVALIQAVMTVIGLSLFGIERAVLLGFVAAFAALIPGIGAGTMVFIPLVAYLMVTGQYAVALGVGVWGFVAVASIDNILGPYLMRLGGTTLHPLIILLSALGGIVSFGLVGFIVGPVIMSVFASLLEIYSAHIARHAEESR